MLFRRAEAEEECHQSEWSARTVDGEKDIIAPGGFPVDEFGDHFLADAGGTLEQYGVLAMRKFPGQGDHLCHFIAFINDVPGGMCRD